MVLRTAALSGLHLFTMHLGLELTSISVIWYLRSSLETVVLEVLCNQPMPAPCVYPLVIAISPPMVSPFLVFCRT